MSHGPQNMTLTRWLECRLWFYIIWKIMHFFVNLISDVNPVISKMWSAFFVLSKLPEIWRILNVQKRQTTFWKCQGYFVVIVLKIIHFKSSWRPNVTNNFQYLRRPSSRLATVICLVEHPAFTNDVYNFIVFLCNIKLGAYTGFSLYWEHFLNLFILKYFHVFLLPMHIFMFI